MIPIPYPELNVSLIVHHPTYAILISTSSIVGSPEHILEREFYTSILHETTEESFCLFMRIWMQGDIDVISLIHGESHRCGNISSHELMSSEDREADMHDEIPSCFIEGRGVWRWWEISESPDRELELSSED